MVCFECDSHVTLDDSWFGNRTQDFDKHTKEYTHHRAADPRRAATTQPHDTDMCISRAIQFKVCAWYICARLIHALHAYVLFDSCVSIHFCCCCCSLPTVYKYVFYPFKLPARRLRRTNFSPYFKRMYQIELRQLLGTSF